MFVLLVTWLIAGQPPHSYQTTFRTMPACQAARAQLVKEAANIEAADRARFAREDAEQTRNEAESDAQARAANSSLLPAPGLRLIRNYTPPRVTAVCVAR